MGKYRFLKAGINFPSSIQHKVLNYSEDYQFMAAFFNTFKGEVQQAIIPMVRLDTIRPNMISKSNDDPVILTAIKINLFSYLFMV